MTVSPTEIRNKSRWHLVVDLEELGMDQSQIKSLIKRIYLELVEGLQSYHILAMLRSEQAIGTFNRYVGFFAPTWIAHRNVLAIKVHNIASQSAKGANFYRALEEIESAQLGDPVEIAAIRTQLDTLRPILSRVGRLRHKRVAHYETDAVIPPVLWADIPALLEDLQGITRATGRLVAMSFMTFDVANRADTLRVLEKLGRSEETKQ